MVDAALTGVDRKQVRDTTIGVAAISEVQRCDYGTWSVGMSLARVAAPQGGGGGQRGQGGVNYRVPPAGSLEQGASYSFRASCHYLQLWMMLNDLQPQQQAAALS